MSITSYKLQISITYFYRVKFTQIYVYIATKLHKFIEINLNTQAISTQT